MTRWVFVRHAESVANRDGWLAGQIDAPLTDRGRDQATDLAGRLDLAGVTRVIASDLSRARETAEILVGAHPLRVETTAALRERHLGAWEGARRDDLRGDGRALVLLSWDRAPPGGESHADCARRVIGWLAAHGTHESTLVVGHGAVLRATLGVLDARAREAVGMWQIANAECLERSLHLHVWRDLLLVLDERPPDTSR